MRKQKEQLEANKSEQLHKVPNTLMGGIWIDALGEDAQRIERKCRYECTIVSSSFESSIKRCEVGLKLKTLICFVLFLFYISVSRFEDFYYSSRNCISVLFLHHIT